MIVYKMNVMERLRLAGYSTYRLRNEKLLGEVAIQKLRDGKMITLNNLDTICRLLRCQPGDIVGYLRDEKDDFISLAPLRTVYHLDKTENITELKDE